MLSYSMGATLVKPKFLPVGKIDARLFLSKATTMTDAWRNQDTIEGKYKTETGISSPKIVVISPEEPSPVLQRLKARQAEMIRKALEYRQEHGDPLDGLMKLLTDLTGDDRKRWKEIVDEPYG